MDKIEQEKILGQPTEKFATDGLTLEEDKTLTGLLSKWKGGRISTLVFTELARIIPQPIVEVVIFRNNDKTLETLLIPRPEGDPVWPGMLHTPGVALRVSDFNENNPLDGPFGRIQRNELNNKFAYTPVFVRCLNRSTQRGPEVVQVHFTELSEPDQKNYVWSSIDELAQKRNFIQHQLEHVNLAAEQYRKRVNIDQF